MRKTLIGLTLVPMFAIATATAPLALAQIDLSRLAGKASGAGLTPDQASGGLKEALGRGIAQAVTSTGHPGAIWTIRISGSGCRPSWSGWSRGCGWRGWGRRWTAL